MIWRTASKQLRGLIILGFVAVVAWGTGLFLFAASLPRQAPADDGITTDGIVVLTGGSERLSVGFDLLRAGKARRLFISGVYRGVEVRELLALSSKSGNDLECCVRLGYDADDTEGNAVETARWVEEEGLTSLRLVTANYHMPRSLVEFRRLVPNVTLVAHPVTPQKVRLDRWWGWPGTAELIVGEYNKYLLAVTRAALTGPRPVVG